MHGVQSSIHVVSDPCKADEHPRGPSFNDDKFEGSVYLMHSTVGPVVPVRLQTSNHTYSFSWQIESPAEVLPNGFYWSMFCKARVQMCHTLAWQHCDGQAILLLLSCIAISGLGSSQPLQREVARPTSSFVQVNHCPSLMCLDRCNYLLSFLYPAEEHCEHLTCESHVPRSEGRASTNLAQRDCWLKELLLLQNLCRVLV
jgi:hypothetical protein